jgi:hypothetical protein
VRRLAGAALLAAALLVPAGGAQAAAPAMLLGFSDISGLQREGAAQRALELQHLTATRGRAVRIMWSWSSIELTKPPTDQAATDPAYGGYDFADLDDLLRKTAAAGVEPLLMVNRAPAWWEGADRPSSIKRNGTWKPDAAAYGRFMTAMARRYSGTFPDPLSPGATLPRVRYWQIWNEPNLYVELNPQWETVGGRTVPASPRLYRALLSAGYDAVKSVSASNVVVTAGTAPYGEAKPCEGSACPTGGPRLQPARFVRELLCVATRGRRLVARNCRATPAKFDILAHHPYPIGPPGRHAINPDDVVVPDFAKLTRPLKVALKAGNIFPRTTSKPVWATEMSWDSNPPDPGGIPAGQQAQYAAGAIYVLWRQGVRALFWWNLRDDPPVHGSYASTLQSGVYYRGATVAEDKPKPAVTAFRFPFVAYRAYKNFAGHGRAKLWGMAPAPGPVTVQRQVGSGWRTIAHARARADHVFLLRVAATRGTRLRAVQAGEASIDAKVF